jgi:hypothetical protein
MHWTADHCGPHHTTTDPAALAVIARLDADFTDAEPGAPVDLTPRRVMLLVLDTLTPDDADLLRDHLLQPRVGPVNAALRGSAWLRAVVDAVAGDAGGYGV